ncbi:sperm-egg fusion protein TMEM95 isoform X3 [Tamandua tetradactyla]|uniref:sperm-egg fusion protein TMEM95 isoform X3 n=1 Tax=Tamandua tetradactyla TaxID=48850 RepID=UPI0040542F11
MWMLALGGVFLAATQACVFCRLPAHDLLSRLTRLCSQMEAQWEECGASWNFSAFALEIKESPSWLPLYWQWLQKIKFPEYTRAALCAPACRGSTTLFNCSTCLAAEVRCWPRKRCFPESHDLREARILLVSLFGAILLLGVVSLVVESRYLHTR